MATQDRLEILSTQLLDQHRPLVVELKDVARIVGQEFGWHYLMDLVWIISQLPMDSLDLVLDAGAGVGILQWYLASRGLDVISVDRLDRSDLAIHFRSRFKVVGLRSQDLSPSLKATFTALRKPVSLKRKTMRFGRDVFSLVNAKRHIPNAGTVKIYNQDLKDLADIPDNSVDAIVAVSALEHNDPAELPLVVAELMRVLKPGGKLVATLSTTGSDDKYHQPSLGWTYSEASLRKSFGLDDDTLSNYDQYPMLFEEIKNSIELKENLARFYYQSGEGGMPWGIWDPQYVPVGVSKVKKGDAADIN